MFGNVSFKKIGSFGWLCKAILWYELVLAEKEQYRKGIRMDREIVENKKSKVGQESSRSWKG